MSGAGMDELLALGVEVGAMLTARGERVAVAESSSGGLLSAALLAVPGASAYYRGGAVIYNRMSIRELTGLDIKALMKTGIRSSSEPFAACLAEAVKTNMRGDWGLSETGAAGPTGNGYGDAAGHSCCAVAGAATAATAATVTRTLETGDSDRPANMVRFAIAALTLFRDELAAAPEKTAETA
ncbi:MAG: CinA family protein [Minwuia sp.]|nr:CinA family protein [Minwuia sp.]